MSSAVFDKALELRPVTDGAETATTSTTGIEVPVRFLGTCDWVIHVTALDAAGADETYVFTLEVSDAVGGTYTAIATHTWPRARSTGKVAIPLSGSLASFQDPDSDWVRVTCTQGGVSSSMTYGSYLAKSSTHIGAAIEPGNTTVVWPA